MAVHVPTRARWWLGLAVAVAIVAGATATGRPDAPVAPVEIYYGTTKVTPPSAAWEPRPHPAKGTTDVPEPRVLPAGGTDRFAPPAPLAFAGPGSAESGRGTATHQTVVVIREPAPAPTSPPAGAPQPTVVIVREPEHRSELATAPTRSPTDWLLAGALVVGLLVVALVLRRPAPAAPVAVHVPTPVPPAPIAPPPAPIAEPKPETVKLADGYDVGPMPKTAQKFDVGPSYREEQKVKETQEEERGGAVLEFILGQNLALRDALEAEPDSPPEPAAPAPAHVVPNFLPGLVINLPEPADGLALWVEKPKT